MIPTLGDKPYSSISLKLTESVMKLDISIQRDYQKNIE